ncbi:DUF397 domain-containing protein [Salinactinospora qingdaonensis]|uniref:DUF397 domain-containing protein n=1 Tax=Salinactinospora qingdaonensis TaxID=702744 RepID=A0ABP7GED1_9ACTN
MTDSTDQLTFFTSSYSGARNNCVEVAYVPSSVPAGSGDDRDKGVGPLGGAAVRDSKHPHRGALFFGAEEWDAFLGAARHNRL